MTGSCQVYIDGQATGSPISIGSSGSTPDNMTVGTHRLYVVYMGNADFQPSTSATVTLTVNPAPLTVTAVNQSRTYGNVNPPFTYAITGFMGSDFLNQTELSGAPVFSTTAVDRTSPVGTYPITITQGTLAYADPNYTLSSAQFVTGKLTIAPAPLTISAANVNRPYGQANPALWFGYSGFVNGETLATSDLRGTPSLATLATPASPVGNYVIDLGAGSLTSTDYTFTFASSTLTVTPAVLTVTAGHATRVYGASAPALSYTITGFVNGDTAPTAVTGTPSLDVPGSSVGTYAFTPGLGTLQAANYTFAFQPGTLTVTPATLTVAAQNASRTYGAANPTQTYAITGFVNGETAGTSGLSGAPYLSTTATTTSPAGTYPIVPSLGTLAANNYIFAFQTATLTVTPVALTVAAVNQSRTYGDLNPAFTYSITGFVGSDFLNQTELSGSPSFSTTAVDRISAAGVYPINITQGTLAYADPDYTFNSAQFVSARLTITPAPLSIALNLPAAELTRSYGQANPNLINLTKDNLRYTGFVNGDNQDNALSGAPSVSTLATSSSPVGSYPITVAAGSLYSPNYTFTFQSATLTVAPAVLTVTSVLATSQYGSTTETTQSYTITGFVNGETLGTSDVTGTPGVATSTTATSSVGTYFGTPSLGTLKSTNYTFQFATTPGTGTLTITPAVLTVAADDISRYYGLPNPALAFAISGYVNGETAATSGLTGAPALSTTATVASPVGTYPITLSQGTLAASNYNFQIVTKPGTLTVATARLIVAASSTQRSFGTPNPASFNWVLMREDAPQTAITTADPDPGLSGAPVLSTQANVNSSVGTYSIVPTQGTLSVANPNYFLDVANFQAGTFSITPATLVITANPATRTYGASDPPFTATISGFIIGQSIANSDLTGAPSFTTTATTTSPVGTYTIVPGTGTLKSANYLFAFVSGVYTITPASLLIEANDISQPFGSTPALSASYIGLESGDTAASLIVPPALSTPATINSLPGNYPITVTGASSPNYIISYQNGTYTVQRSPTAATLDGPLLRAALTSPVTFTAAVSSGSGGTIPLSGNLTFYDQFGAIGSVPVVGGKVVFSTSALRVGNYQIYAIYGGDNNYQPSSTITISLMIFNTTPAAAPKPAAPAVAHHAKPSPKPKPAPKPKAHAVAKAKPAVSRAHAVVQGRR